MNYTQYKIVDCGNDSYAVREYNLWGLLSADREFGADLDRWVVSLSPLGNFRCRFSLEKAREIAKKLAAIRDSKVVEVY